jgi:hypothetical protein
LMSLLSSHISQHSKDITVMEHVLGRKRNAPQILNTTVSLNTDLHNKQNTQVQNHPRAGGVAQQSTCFTSAEP